MTKKELAEQLARFPDDAPVYVHGERTVTEDGLYPVEGAYFDDDPEAVLFTGVPRGAVTLNLDVTGEIGYHESPVYAVGDRVLVTDPDGAPDEPGMVKLVHPRGHVPFPGIRPGEYVGRELTDESAQFYDVVFEGGVVEPIGQADMEPERGTAAAAYDRTVDKSKGEKGVRETR